MLVEYKFEGETKTVDVTDGDVGKPMVVLLHGTGGDIRDMTDPTAVWPENYDYTANLPPDRDIGWRAYPGIGVWSFELDAKKSVESWRDILVRYKFPVAVYPQVDKSGFLARPVLELAVVMETLMDHYQKISFVLLGQSRGGLLIRAFLKDHRKLTRRISKVITLHSPHTGGQLANVANFLRDAIEDLRDSFGNIVLTALGWLLDIVESDAYQELAQGSSFLEELADGESAISTIQYYTFGGTSVRLTRILSWLYTLESAIPQWHWPPYRHARTMIEVPFASPILDSLPNFVDEIQEGKGDMLTADSSTRLPFATHRTNNINHVETLWHPTLQAQVLQILGSEPSFWA
jgi:pimeloyl-ACP methyl ester carboxylesterase